jgi:cytochrome P450
MSERDQGRGAGTAAFELTDPVVGKCPYPFFERLRAEHDVPHDPAVGWLASRHRDLRATLTDTEHFSNHWFDDEGPKHMGIGPQPIPSEVQELLDQYYPMVYAYAFSDAPTHTRHRTIVKGALSPGVVRDLEPSIRETAHALVDNFIERGRFELMSDYAVPVPLIVISDMLGVPRDHMADFRHWSDCMMAGNIMVLTNEQRLVNARAVLDFQRYFIPEIERRREQPTEDLLSALTNTEVMVDGVGMKCLETKEILPIISQILLAGNETTANLIGNAMVLLLRNPDVMAEVRADNALIPALLEEVMRYESPLQCVYRRAKTGATVADTPIPEGDLVAILYGAANSDPDAFSRPSEFDVHRTDRREHLGFGHGPHFCPGAPLARLESKIAFEVLFERLGVLALDCEFDDLEQLESYAVRAFKEVPLKFEAK